ncbi:ferritin-like domain-containing protein [Sediminicola luteus]|uniref:PA2169 family four-helix-bundle protein n=1 Tax=Sediminicola luteus TaxID=319238 RepID=A0ABV2TWD2_9FLAO
MKRDNMKYSEKISNRLNDLLEKTYDAEKGFKLAQDKIDDSTTKKFLNDRAEQRAAFGHELKREITQYGEIQDTDGSVKGDMHRAWMNLKSAVASNENEKILEEVERGEKASLEEYNEIIKDEDMVLPPSTKSTLMRQRDAIESSLTVANIHEHMA